MSDTKFADYAPRTAFLFPGQGAQTVGMAKARLKLRSVKRFLSHRSLKAAQILRRSCPEMQLNVPQDVYKQVPAAKTLFDRASEVLGYDLLQACVEGAMPAPEPLSPLCWAGVRLMSTSQSHRRETRAGPKERLDSTAISQPAIYVASLAAVEKLRAEEGDVRSPHASPSGTSGRRAQMNFKSPPMQTTRCCAAQAAVEAADVACGLSLGEYTALAFAGAFR